MTAPDLSRQEMATRLLAIAVVKGRIAEEERRLRVALTAGLVTGAREAGVIDPADPEGTALGFVTKKKGATSARVTDPAALLGWAREFAPSEVVNVPTVRPAFVTRLLDAVKKDGGWVDPETSELIDVDGVQVVTGDPGLMVKASDEADRLVSEALAGHRLALLSAQEDTP